MTDIIEHMAAFERRKAAAEAASHDGDSGLDFYNDAACQPPDFNEMLTRALINDDEPAFILNDGTVIEWSEHRRCWVECTAPMRDLLESAFIIDEHDLDRTHDSLNEIGHLIQLCEQRALPVMAELKDAATRILSDLSAACDMDTAPDDTRGVWAWNSDSLLMGEGWEFTLAARHET